jgi:putative ABC transport system ATP-binding protein
MQLFRDLVKDGKTVLLVTHERDIAQHVTRIVRLADGEIVNGHDLPGEAAHA